MLTEKEKALAKGLVELLDDDDLMSLFETTTKRAIDASNLKDAADGIVAFTHSTKELLNRRKIGKELLLQYTYKMKLPFSIKWSKDEIMRIILNYWAKETEGEKPPESSDKGNKNASSSKKSKGSSSQDNQKKSSQGATTDPSNQAPTSSNPPPPASVDSLPLQGTTAHHPSHAGAAYVPPQTHTAAHAPAQHAVASRPVPVHDTGGFLDMKQPMHLHSVPPTVVNNTTYNININCSVAENVQTDHEQLSGIKFVSWFFDMLNSLNPVFHLKPQNFGPQHFWENAELHLHMVLSTASNSEDICGSMNVCERLASFTQNDRLLFNPNLNSDGVMVKSDPHGLKLIMVCGSLHKDNNCVGVFQQSFGLVCDPRSRDIMKIKISFLKMQEGFMQRIPNLKDSPDSAIIEELTVKALK